LFRSVAISANKLTVATVGRGGRSGGVTRLPPTVSADRGDVLATKRRRGRHSDNHDKASGGPDFSRPIPFPCARRIAP